jgi:hypothetical protein
MRGDVRAFLMTLPAWIHDLHRTSELIIHQTVSSFCRTYFLPFYRASTLALVWALIFFTKIHLRSHFLIHSLLFAIKPTIVKLH